MVATAAVVGARWASVEAGTVQQVWGCVSPHGVTEDLPPWKYTNKHTDKITQEHMSGRDIYSISSHIT